MDYSFVKNKLIYVPIILFVFFSFWWLYLRGLDLNLTENPRQLFALLYQIMSIYGGIIGIIIANKWGGYKSILGKVILAFSIGLLFQSLGQSIYSYFIYFKKIEVPYPSLGDIGYFGSVILYIIGAIYLANVSGFKFSFQSFKGKFISIIIPLLILISSYLFFLNGYEYDWSNKLKMFLDFGYPLGQAFYLSIALLAFLMSRNILGGLMKKPIIFIILALVFQYLCDFTFLYQASRGAWYVGGVNDYMYFTSYFIMTLALIYMGSMFKKIQES